MVNIVQLRILRTEFKNSDDLHYLFEKFRCAIHTSYSMFLYILPHIYNRHWWVESVCVVSEHWLTGEMTSHTLPQPSSVREISPHAFAPQQIVAGLAGTGIGNECGDLRQALVDSEPWPRANVEGFTKPAVCEMFSHNKHSRTHSYALTFRAYSIPIALFIVHIFGHGWNSRLLNRRCASANRVVRK